MKKVQILFVQRTIFALQEKAPYQIAYILRQMDPSRKWSQISVLRMLKNIAYTGRFKYDGVVYPKKEEWVIISDEMFELAQKNIDARRTTPKNISTAPRGKHLLTGLLFCGHCGSRMCGRPIRIYMVIVTGIGLYIVVSKNSKKAM